MVLDILTIFFFLLQERQLMKNIMKHKNYIIYYYKL